MLSGSSSLPWAVGPLTITAAVAVLDLEAFGLFPTRRTACMVRILKKKNRKHKVKDGHAEIPGSLCLTSAGSKSKALNPGSSLQTQAIKAKERHYQKGLSQITVKTAACYSVTICNGDRLLQSQTTK